MRRFNKIAKSTLINTARVLPFQILQKRCSDINPLIINYHIVSDQQVPHYQHISKYRNIRDFRRDMFCLIRKFKPITLNQLIGHIKNTNAIPENSVHLTFDDGYKEVYEIIAPILTQMDIPASFFVNSGFIDNNSMFYRNKASALINHLNFHQKDLKKEVQLLENKHGIAQGQLTAYISTVKYKDREILNDLSTELSFNSEEYLKTIKPYLTTEQIRDLIKQGFSIGSHSIDHPNFSQISVEEQIRQVKESTEIINEKFNLTNRAFAFTHRGDGIPKEFFDRIESEYPIDVFFGTYDQNNLGINNFKERTGIMESYNVSLNTGIKYYFLKKYLK